MYQQNHKLCFLHIGQMLQQSVHGEFPRGFAKNDLCTNDWCLDENVVLCRKPLMETATTLMCIANYACGQLLAYIIISIYIYILYFMCSINYLFAAKRQKWLISWSAIILSNGPERDVPNEHVALHLCTKFICTLTKFIELLLGNEYLEYWLSLVLMTCCKHTWVNFVSTKWTHTNINQSKVQGYIYVTGSADKGLVADPNSTYLESCSWTCEFGTALKLSPNIPLIYQYCVKVIAWIPEEIYVLVRFLFHNFMFEILHCESWPGQNQSHDQSVWVAYNHVNTSACIALQQFPAL